MLVVAALALAGYYFRYLVGGGTADVHARQLLGLCLLGVASRPLLEPREFRVLLLSLSSIGCAVWAGLDCLVIFGFVALVIGASRSKLPTWLRVVGVSLLWSAVPVAKLCTSRIDLAWPYFSSHRGLLVYWAGVPFSVLYLVIERERGLLDEQSWLDDALYLLALPRLASPFFQAIPASSFFRSQAERRPELRLAWRGATLLLYGAALWVLLRKLPYIFPKRPGIELDPRFIGTPRALHNVLFVYAANASSVFCAVGVFRLLGFDLASGFRWPFLSTSFAEFYRRWNHYVYDTVKSLFLFPLLGRFRTFLPAPVAAATAGYLAIFLGSFGLTRVLVPVTMTANPWTALKLAFEPEQFLILGAFWSLILLPQLLPKPNLPRLAGVRGKMVGRLVFLTVLAVLAYAAGELGVVLI